MGAVAGKATLLMPRGGRLPTPAQSGSSPHPQPPPRNGEGSYFFFFLSAGSKNELSAMPR